MTSPEAADDPEPPPYDLPRIPDGPPLVIVLSSVAGAGKDAVRDLLMAWDLPFHFVVTATDRPPRDDEVEGVHYHFLSSREFDKLIAEGGFIEHALVYGQKKGVPAAEIEGPLAEGRDVLARVDVQGAETLRNLYGQKAILIWIAPPSLEAAENRMRLRATDGDEQTRTRLQAAPAESEQASTFDYIVVNEDGRVTETALRVVEIVAAEKASRSRPQL